MPEPPPPTPTSARSTPDRVARARPVRPWPACVARTQWLAWLAMAVVLGVALAIGAGGSTGPRTDAQRAHGIATEIRCPTCRGLSAADSDAPAATAIREEILRRVQAGETDGAIRAYLVSRYSADILLKPEGRGVAGLVWAIPVAALVVAVGLLVLAFRRWHTRAGGALSDADRALVDEALHP